MSTSQTLPLGAEWGLAHINRYIAASTNVTLGKTKCYYMRHCDVCYGRLPIQTSGKYITFFNFWENTDSREGRPWCVYCHSDCVLSKQHPTEY